MALSPQGAIRRMTVENKHSPMPGVSDTRRELLRTIAAGAASVRYYVFTHRKWHNSFKKTVVSPFSLMGSKRLQRIHHE